MTSGTRPPTSTEQISGALLDAWAVVFPVVCAGCGAWDRGLCLGCRNRLIPDGEPSALVRWTLPDGTLGFAARSYDRLTASVLLAYKQDGRTGLRRPLAASMRPAFEAALAACAAPDAPPVEIAIVPARRRAATARGFHPVEQLVRTLGARSTRPLRWRREPADQRRFGRADRLSNLDGALVARTNLAGRRFLLVDDVVTTGATLHEAVRALNAADAAVVAVGALARVLP